MTAKAGAESALGTDVLARLRVASTERALGAEGLPGLSGYFGLDMEPPTDTGPAGGAAAMPATYTVLPTDTGPVGGIGTTDHGSA